jgi:pimeloyl-ACP methyl ester carboxylesterase
MPIPNPQSGCAEIDGARLYFEMQGEGPRLVLVHAGIADRRMWDDQFSVLSREYRVLRYDMRGFGKSPMTPGPFSRRGDLFRLLQSLGFARTHVLGCSTGGMAAIDFALEHPAMAASLILVSPAVGGYAYAGPPTAKVRELISALRSRELDRAAELQVEIWVDGPKRGPERVDTRVRDLVREMSRDALSAQSDFLSETGFVAETPLAPPAIGRLDQIAVPVLVVVGDCDDDSNQAVAGALELGLPNAAKVIIRGAAHLPNMEKAEEFNRTVLAFLKGCPAE